MKSVLEAARLHRIININRLGLLKAIRRYIYKFIRWVFLRNRLMECHFSRLIKTSDRVQTALRTTGHENWNLAKKIVQPTEVEWAIKTFKSYKAPGPDGIYPALLQKGLNELLCSLTKLFRASIALKYISKTWMGTRVAFISKPGRNGHILVKDFRPISLTSFFLKTLEKLIDRFLKATSMLTKPLGNSQYAYRKGRSTETALHHLVSAMETQLEDKGYALGCFMDIEKVFDSTSNNAVGKAIVSHGISGTMELMKMNR